MAFYKLDLELGQRIFEIIDRFPSSFGHIDGSDVAPISIDDGRGTTFAEVRVVAKWMQATQIFKLGLLTYSHMFEPLSLNAQDMILIHELEHIDIDPNNPSGYILKKHTVEDWSVMVKTMGPTWPAMLSDNENLDIMQIASSSDWKTAVTEMMAGREEIVDGYATTGPRKRRRKHYKRKHDKKRSSRSSG